MTSKKMIMWQDATKWNITWWRLIVLNVIFLKVSRVQLIFALLMRFKGRLVVSLLFYKSFISDKNNFSMWRTACDIIFNVTNWHNKDLYDSNFTNSGRCTSLQFWKTPPKTNAFRRRAVKLSHSCVIESVQFWGRHSKLYQRAVYRLDGIGWGVDEVNFFTRLFEKCKWDYSNNPCSRITLI